MAARTDPPKHSQRLAQLERVCRLQHALAKSSSHHPNAVHRIKYKDTLSQPQSIELDAQFNLGLRKIRRALISECHDQGFAEEMAQIFQRIEGL